ncbi:MAG: DNA-directed RNA polymerase subunit omega [Proteobacteria bacterium]|nr:DNA-directed RNA polymerase subunit omega [Pseudomonadota bacterium]
MARITVEDSLKKAENRFGLVLLASQRAKQLHKGSEVLIEGTNNREVVTALREVAAGKVAYARPEFLHVKKEDVELIETSESARDSAEHKDEEEA